MSPAPTPQLSGSKTTTAGILSLIMGGLTLFTHIWSVAKGGGQLDPTTLLVGSGLITTGIGGIHSADQKQPPAGQ